MLLWAGVFFIVLGFFCLAIDLHRTYGLDALRTGLALLPMTVVTGAMAFLSGRLVSRIGEWTAIVVGLTAGAAGALLVSVAAGGGVTTLIVSKAVMKLVSKLPRRLSALTTNPVSGICTLAVSRRFWVGRITAGSVA